MAEIRAIHGGSIPGKADADIVETLERLLDEARQGDITAIAYAVVRPDEIGTGWTGGAGTRDGIGMAISLLAARYPLSVLGD